MEAGEIAMQEPPVVRTKTEQRPKRSTSAHCRMCANWAVFGVLAAVLTPLALLNDSPSGKSLAAVAFCFFVLAYLSLICAKLDDIRK